MSRDSTRSSFKTDMETAWAWLEGRREVISAIILRIVAGAGVEHVRMT